MARIRLEGIKKGFKDVKVIDELNLTINDGEFFTFVGPSGCGKSTILNMIAGLEPVSEGRIFFDDMAVNELSSQDRDVAMVFQSYALYPHMTVYENMAFPLKMKQVEKTSIDKEIKWVASLVGIEDLLRRRPRELSGGQRQRVALGRAIIRKPKVFLMDEPLSNLDARLRTEMRTELKKLHQGLRITTVYVTHDQAEAMSLSERMAILNNGMIQQCGIPQEIYMKPKNIFVAGFIGSPSMNFIPASVKKLKPFEVYCNGVTFSPLIETMPEKEELIVGIRPDDIHVNEKAEDGIRVVISVIEHAGAFMWVDIIWNNLKIKGVSKTEAELKPGDNTFMKFAIDKAIVFDAVSGRRL